MKRLMIPVMLLAIVAGCKNHGWSEADKTGFITNCMTAAKEGMGETRAKSYCDCLEPKMEAKYPDNATAQKHAEDFNKPEWQAIIQNCLR